MDSAWVLQPTDGIHDPDPSRRTIARAASAAEAALEYLLDRMRARDPAREVWAWPFDEVDDVEGIPDQVLVVTLHLLDRHTEAPARPSDRWIPGEGA